MDKFVLKHKTSKRATAHVLMSYFLQRASILCHHLLGLFPSDTLNAFVIYPYPVSSPSFT